MSGMAGCTDFSYTKDSLLKIDFRWIVVTKICAAQKVMIIDSQMPIMFCWVRFYLGARAVLALLIHSAFCILGRGCLVLAQIMQTGPAGQQQA